MIVTLERDEDAAAVRVTHDADAMARRTGAVAREIIESSPETALFVTGGDTALAVVQALESTTLYVYEELAPGVPIGAICGSRHNQAPVPVVTKAGGYGDDSVATRLPVIDVPVPETGTRSRAAHRMTSQTSGKVRGEKTATGVPTSAEDSSVRYVDRRRVRRHASMVGIDRVQ